MADEPNLLLQSLEPPVRERFAGQFQAVEFKRNQVLHIPGSPVEWVYFVRRGLVGVFSDTLDGESLQSAIVGFEGGLGLLEACGSRQWFTRSSVEIDGEGVRLSARQYRHLYDRSPALRTAVHLYTEQLLMEARQLVVCNALHGVENRLSRSLLEALERSGLDEKLPLTQLALSKMIGAQRTTVAAAISNFQRDGLISSQRGSIEVFNRAGLERLACACRRTMRYAAAEIQSSDVDSCEATVPD